MTHLSKKEIKVIGHHILNSAYLPLLLTVIGIIFMLPSLDVGLIMDDWIQRVP